MDREGLDALVAVTANNVCYLSDFESDFLYDVPWVACAVLPRSSDLPPTLIVTEIEAAVLVQRPSWMPEVRLYYFGIYGGALKVHTFAEQLETPEDRAIAAMVRQLQRQPWAGLMEAAGATLQEQGLHRARLGLDDTRCRCPGRGVG